MDLNYKIEETDINSLYNIMIAKQRNGYRLTQICATAFEGYNELIYSVSKGYEFENYKITVPIETEISTISDFFPSAQLYENEMKELFGVKIQSINPDYKNKFYRIKVETPFKKEIKENIKIVKKENDENKETDSKKDETKQEVTE